MTVRVLPRPAEAQPRVETPVLDPWTKLKARRLPYLFLSVVVAPAVFGAFYLFVLASPRYVSEAKFIVRAPSDTQAMGLAGALHGVSLGGAAGNSDPTFPVQEYIWSRAAIADLERQLPFRRMLAPPGADFLARFPRPFPLENKTNESLWSGYKRFVDVSIDATTEVTTLKVTMFRPQDAHAVAAALLDGAEALVNRLNDRSLRDSTAAAEKLAAEAVVQVNQIENQLTRFRNGEHVLDPAVSTTAEQDVQNKLAEQLASLQAERSGLAASAPHDPQLPGLDERIKAYQRQLSSQNARIAGQASSLAPKISEYEKLTIRRDMAEKLLAAATESVETARDEARRKQIYIERIADPSVADLSTEPRKFMILVVLTVSCLLAFAMISLIRAGFREHRQS